MTGAGDSTIGLALIVRDEEQMLPGLLDSVAGCFDQVALLDTGSTDRTVELFETWAAAEAQRQPGFEARLGEFSWCDDFAAARNAADALLDSGWRAWADADDAIRGADQLRRFARLAEKHSIDGWLAGYETSHTLSGAVVGYTQRIRLVRSGAARWVDPVHEELELEGKLAAISPATATWVHRKAFKRDVLDSGRNLRIVLEWLQREPDSRRALDYAGREHAVRGDHAAAIEYFERFIALNPGWDDLSARLHRHYAVSLMALGRHADAARDARAVVASMPDWPDSYLTLAEAALEAGDYAAAVADARHVLELGPPRSTLPHVVTDYTAQPRLLIARALRAMGDADESRRAADEALAALSAGAGDA